MKENHYLFIYPGDEDDGNGGGVGKLEEVGEGELAAQVQPASKERVQKTKMKRKKKRVLTPPEVKEMAAIDSAVADAIAKGQREARFVSDPYHLDLADTASVKGAFAGLDVVIHLAANIFQDASWEKISRNNIGPTFNVLEECVSSGVRRFIFASSNHTQAANFFTSLDPAVPGALCEIKSPDTLYADQPRVTLHAPAAPSGFYGISKLFGEDMCKLYSQRYGLETVALRIGWFKGGE